MRKGWALPRHYNDLTERTKREYSLYYWRHYENAAQEHDVPIYAPGEEFLEAYLEREATISVARAHRRIAAITYKFWEQGLPDPTTGLPILRVLYGLSQPQRTHKDEVLGLMPKAARAYAGYYVDGQYAPRSQRQWEQRGHSWEAWARAHGVDPQRPQPGDLVRHLRSFDGCTYSTLCNRRNGLFHYFDDRHLPDVSAAPEVDLFFEGQRRRPSRLRPPILIDGLRRIASVLSDDRLDKRVHFTTLLAFFGPLTGVTMSRLDVPDIAVRADGLEISADGRMLFFDRFEDEPDLDVVRAYERYRDSVEWREGRLFRAMGLRHDFLETCSPRAVTSGIAHAAARAGITGSRIAERLNAGGRFHLVSCFGVIVAARRLGVSATSLANSFPSTRAEAQQIASNKPLPRSRNGRQGKG